MASYSSSYHESSHWSRGTMGKRREHRKNRKILFLTAKSQRILSKLPEMQHQRLHAQQLLKVTRDIQEVIPHIFTQQIFIPPFGMTSNVHQAVWKLSNSHRILWASIAKSIQQILQKKAHRKSPTCDTAPLYPVHRKFCKHPEIPAIQSNQNQKIRKTQNHEQQHV